MNNTKRFSENPLAGEKIFFVEMSDDNHGRRTVIEAELAAHAKGTPVHYHNTVTETFYVLEGELNIELNGKKLVVQKGESAHVPLFAHHRFYNESGNAVKFRAEIIPGCKGFEQSVKIIHGLAKDGKCNSKGIPKNISELAVLFELGEGKVPGILSIITPILSFVAKKARKKGVEKNLIAKYC